MKNTLKNLKNKKVISILLASVLVFCSLFCIFAFTQNNDNTDNIQIIYKRTNISTMYGTTEDQVVKDFDIKYEIIDAEHINVSGSIEGKPFSVTSEFISSHPMDTLYLETPSLNRKNFYDTNFKTLYYKPEKTGGDFEIRRVTLSDIASIVDRSDTVYGDIDNNKYKNILEISMKPGNGAEGIIYIFIFLDKDIVGPYLDNNGVFISEEVHDYFLWELEIAAPFCNSLTGEIKEEYRDIINRNRNITN